MDLAEKRKELIRKAGLAIVRPAVKGVMGLVNVDRMLEDLMKMRPDDEKAVKQFLDTVKGLIADVGLESTVLYYMFDELTTTVQKDSDFHQKLHSALARGLERWKKANK